MGFLSDKELRAAARSTPPKLLSGLDPSSITSEIYGCAVYMHVGDVFLPGRKAGDIGSASSPIKLQYSLLEGQTALIRTAESFQLDSDHAALVLPSSSVSMQGLLMTNPGHVDPGYAGKLHVTVINMSSEPFAITPNMRFLRALIFKIDSTAESPLKAVIPPKSPVTDELLNRLSLDFLNVDDRARMAAKSEIASAVRTNTWVQFAVPAFFAVLAAGLTGTFNYFSQAKDVASKLDALQKINAGTRLGDLETRIPTAQRLQALELEVERLKSQAKK
jgi:dCTP deaminase